MKPTQHKTPEELDQLTREQQRGDRARRAYEEFIQPFIEQKMKVFFEAFHTCEPDDVKRLSEIRRMSMAVQALDDEIKSFITTGQMAKIQLEEENATDQLYP
jgi:hypothetical protein